MGRKSKLKQAVNRSTAAGSSLKRKQKNEKDPPAKRRKKDIPGKYVLLKPPADDESQIESTSENENKQKTKRKKQHEPAKASGSQKVNGKSKKKLQTDDISMEQQKVIQSKLTENIKSQISVNGPKESQLVAIYNNDLLSDSDDDSYDDDFESLSEEEEVGEEWSTDTDYTEDDSLCDDEEDEYSFHESDCENVSDDDEEPRNYWNDDESEGSDYVPDVEDKYIKAGEAILYVAKGLNLAFGNSKESQIIEVNDITPALTNADDEVPQLVPPEGNKFEEDITEHPVEVKEAPEIGTEKLLGGLQTEEEEENFNCSRLSQFATFFNTDKDNAVIVKLSGTIYFHGILMIKALANSVQVNGYILEKDESLTVASISRADCFLNLTPIITGNIMKETLEKHFSYSINGPIDLHQSNRIDFLEDFNPDTEAIVLLQYGLPSVTMEMLKTYSSHPLLPNKKMLLSNISIQSSELILSTKFFVANENQKVNTFQLNSQWNYVEVMEKSKILVAGGKNVGKSGLCQFLINKNIRKFKKILLIDLDIGQPICSAAQTVSATIIEKPIIGAGYLNNNNPEKCILYGDKSVMISPFKYIRCVRQLMKFCSQKLEYENIPWIINTMGYQKGFGLQLMCLLIKVFQPTDVVQIQHSFVSYNFSKVLTEENVNSQKFYFFDESDLAGLPNEVTFTTHVLDSIVNNRESDVNSKWVSNASDKRKLSMLAQLSKLMNGNQMYLNDLTPFVAPISQIKMVVMYEDYEYKQQGFNLDLLNGNLVYLCKTDGNEELDSSSILECFGVGLVRGIDKVNEQIFLLLPQQGKLSTLQSKINVLAIGNIPLPAELLLKQSFNVTGIIPHVTFFKDRNITSKKHINKRSIKDCF